MLVPRDCLCSTSGSLDCTDDKGQKGHGRQGKWRPDWRKGRMNRQWEKSTAWTKTLPASYSLCCDVNNIWRRVLLYLYYVNVYFSLHAQLPFAFALQQQQQQRRKQEAFVVIYAAAQRLADNPPAFSLIRICPIFAHYRLVIGPEAANQIGAKLGRPGTRLSQ